MSDLVPPSRAQLVLVRAIAGVVAVIGLGLAFEGFASLALLGQDFSSARAPRYSRSHTAHDTLLGWVNRPDFSLPDEYGPGIGITTNSLGLRGPRSPLATDTSAIRLVCTGDSVTLGYGVADENTWCALLAKYFPRLETLNMGQADYGLDQAYLWYQRDGDRVKHHVQIFAITAVEFERSVTTTHRGRFKPTLELKGDQITTSNVPVPEQTVEALNSAHATRLQDDLAIMRIIRRVPALDGTKEASRLVDQRWPMFEAVFRELHEFNNKRGVELVLAYLPIRNDLRPGPLDDRRAKIAAFAVKHQIRFIDLTPQFRAMRPDSVDLSLITRIPSGSAPGIAGHYTNLGNAWVAKAFAERLADMSVLNRPSEGGTRAVGPHPH